MQIIDIYVYIYYSITYPSFDPPKGITMEYFYAITLQFGSQTYTTTGVAYCDPGSTVHELYHERFDATCEYLRHHGIIRSKARPTTVMWVCQPNKLA